MTVFGSTDRPKLHPCVQFQEDPTTGEVYVADRLQRNGPRLRLGAIEGLALQMFDGRRTLRDIQLEIMRLLGGRMIPLDHFARLLQVADDVGYLDGSRFQQLRDNPIREPSCLDAYPDQPGALRDHIRDLFLHPEGSGLPREGQPNGRLRAVLVPHIDYARGGLTYTWGFKDLFEHSDASLFVIIGTSHCSPHRFTLTRKHFRTPLGVVPTDQAYIDRLVQHYGDGLFDDELGAHLPEHSIELEVVFLQFLYEGRRPIRIVPLVVGSFFDCIDAGNSPSARADISRMVRALQQAEAETREPICYVISGDLAHIGPYFRDPAPVHPDQLQHSRRQDQAILHKAAAGDGEGYFRVIAAEQDARRICGLPPTYLVLEALRPSRGRLLHYDQYVHPQNVLSVSFASVSFDP
jgi:AmmeMemoRadiSam system protein B